MNDMVQDQFQRMVGRRVQIARKQLGLTQKQLSSQLGFSARQSLSYIEDGQRKVSAGVLLKLMQTLDKTLEFFTDPFLLIDEAAVSWRATDAPKDLKRFEEKILPMVALYRHLTNDRRQSQTVLVAQLPITADSSFEEAGAAAERLGKEWELGDIPSKNLAARAEQKLNVLILMVDAPSKISGAAVHLREFDTVLINRRESAGRRNYDFGHELFHVLTWHCMAPPYIDEEKGKTKQQQRIEQLANKFTSALLMPAHTVTSLWTAREDREVTEWLKDAASVLEVSGIALYWRLVDLGLLSKDGTETIRKQSLARESVTAEPKLYSRGFMAALHEGLDRGAVSVRKAATILDCTIDNLEELFREHGFEPPFDL